MAEGAHREAVDQEAPRAVRAGHELKRAREVFGVVPAHVGGAARGRAGAAQVGEDGEAAARHAGLAQQRKVLERLEPVVVAPVDEHERAVGGGGVGGGDDPGAECEAVGQGAEGSRAERKAPRGGRIAAAEAKLGDLGRIDARLRERHHRVRPDLVREVGRCAEHAHEPQAEEREQGASDTAGPGRPEQGVQGHGAGARRTPEAARNDARRYLVLSLCAPP